MLQSLADRYFEHVEIVIFHLNVNLIPDFNLLVKFLSCVKFHSVQQEYMHDKTFCQYNFSSVFRSL